MAMQSQEVRAGLNTPLTQIGELPDELFLACLQSVPTRLQDALINKRSAQLSTKRPTHH